jgi:hypothetical protein
MTRASKAFALVSTWTELALGWYALAALGPGIRILTIVIGVIATGTLLFIVRTVATPNRRLAPSAVGSRQSAVGRRQSAVFS